MKDSTTILYHSVEAAQAHTISYLYEVRLNAALSQLSLQILEVTIICIWICPTKEKEVLVAFYSACSVNIYVFSSLGNVL